MSDTEDQKNFEPQTSTTPTDAENTIEVEKRPETATPLPKKSSSDSFLRGCGYVLAAATIIVLLLSGACFIMLFGFH